MKNIIALYEQLIERIDAGVHAIDQHGTNVIYNEKMAEIESMSRDDVLGKNVLDVFPFSSEAESTLLQAVRYGQHVKNMKQTYFNHHGKAITTINETFPVYDNGVCIGAIELAKDVTKLEQLMRDTLHKKAGTRYSFSNIIGDSEAIQDVIEASRRATRTTSSVLIVGETGTGKELFAQSIHSESPRANAPFIAQNCAALPEELIEGLLFGTAKGAFTGAIERAGLFELANGGTLLLDEMNSLNTGLQAKLLRAIQEKTIRRIGAAKDTTIDVRIIATMNEDPIDAVQAGRLRKDLYYRLSVVPLFIPPLRERKQDIPALVHSFIAKYNELFHLRVSSVSDDVMNLFFHYDWPGNVRELEHVIEGAFNLIDAETTISAIHLPVVLRRKLGQQPESRPTTLSITHYLAEMEKQYVQKILAQTNGNISQAAKLLGISRQSLQYRIKKGASL